MHVLLLYTVSLYTKANQHYEKVSISDLLMYVCVRGVRIRSENESESDPIRSDRTRIGFGSKFMRPDCIGSDFMAFISDWIGLDYVGFFPDQIGFVFHEKFILQGRNS